MAASATARVPPVTDRLGRAPCVVFDLEYTAWQGSRERGWSGPGELREIVQIGAVRLDPRDGWRETAALDLLVRPRVNPRLSVYFVALTGIDQARLDRHGMPPAAAIAAFAEFCRGDRAYCWGDDGRIIKNNLELNTIPDPFEPDQLVDLRTWLCGRLGLDTNGLSSGDLPAALGSAAAGPAHDALADARAIAIGLRHLPTTIGL